MRWLFLVLFPAAAAAAPMPPGRVAHLEGKLFARGPRDTEWSQLSRNALVRSGDQLQAPVGSFVELELRGRIFVYVAGGSSIEVEDFGDDAVLSVFSGA